MVVSPTARNIDTPEAHEFFKQKALDISQILLEREERGLCKAVERQMDWVDWFTHGLVSLQYRNKLRKRLYRNLILDPVRRVTRGCYPAHKAIFDTHVAS